MTVSSPNVAACPESWQTCQWLQRDLEGVYHSVPVQRQSVLDCSVCCHPWMNVSVTWDASWLKSCVLQSLMKQVLWAPTGSMPWDQEMLLTFQTVYRTLTWHRWLVDQQTCSVPPDTGLVNDRRLPEWSVAKMYRQRTLNRLPSPEVWWKKYAITDY